MMYIYLICFPLLYNKTPEDGDFILFIAQCPREEYERPHGNT